VAAFSPPPSVSDPPVAQPARRSAETATGATHIFAWNLFIIVLSNTLVWKSPLRMAQAQDRGEKYPPTNNPT
jgi:hypothetical protein